MLGNLRTNKGITSTFVAQKLGISRDRLKRIEENKAMLPAEFVPILADLYGISCKTIIEERAAEWIKLKKVL